MTDTLPADRWKFELPLILYGAVRHLLELDDRMLADVGLDGATATAEGGKGFWS